MNERIGKIDGGRRAQIVRTPTHPHSHHTRICVPSVQTRKDAPARSRFRRPPPPPHTHAPPPLGPRRWWWPPPSQRSGGRRPVSCVFFLGVGVCVCCVYFSCCLFWFGLLVMFFSFPAVIIHLDWQTKEKKRGTRPNPLVLGGAQKPKIVMIKIIVIIIITFLLAALDLTIQV